MMLALVSGMLEMVSVAAILPFLAVLSDPTRVETHALLHRIYDELGFTTPIDFLVFLSLCVLGLVVLSLGVRLVTIYAIARFANMRAYSLSSRLIENYLRQPYPWFLGRNGAHLSKVILVEVQRVVNEAIMPVMLTLSQFALVLSLFGLLLVVEPTIALFAVVLFGGSYVLVYILARRALAQIGSVILASNGERFKAVHEAMSSIKDVKILGVERTFLERFRKPTGEMAMVSSRAAVIGEAPRSILQALALAGMLVLILHLLVNRSGTLNDIVPTMGIFAFAGLRLFRRCRSIYRQIGDAGGDPTRGRRALRRHDGDRGPGDDLAKDRAPLPLDHQLELDGIGYAYPEASRTALAEPRPRGAARSSVGIVGGTGAGKTTLVDIMLCLLWPDEGSIRVDGVPVTRENLRAWQKNIGYVPQEISHRRRHGRRQHRLRHPDQRIDMAAVERAAAHRCSCTTSS